MATAFSIEALASEFTNDPESVGYATAIGASDDEALTELINSNTGNGSGTVYLNNVQLNSLLNAITSTSDWDAIAVSGTLFNSIQLLALVEPLDCSQTNTQVILNHIIAGLSSDTQAAILAAVSKMGSRAEVLWGVNFTITPEQCSLAR